MLNVSHNKVSTVSGLASLSALVALNLGACVFGALRRDPARSGSLIELPWESALDVLCQAVISAHLIPRWVHGSQRALIGDSPGEWLAELHYRRQQHA